MVYRERRPGASMARFIKCYWLLEDACPIAEPQRVVPDGRPQLILNLGAPYETLRGSTWTRQPSRFIVGQITGPLMLRGELAHVIRVVLMAHHMIVSAREASAGRQTASHYSARALSASIESESALRF